MALAVSVVMAASSGPARAQEEEVTVAQFPEGASRAEVGSVTLEPGEAGVGVGGRKMLQIAAEVKQEVGKNERRRELHIGKSFSESLKTAGAEAAAAKVRIRSAAGGEEARYSEWLRGVSGLDVVRTPLATVRLTQFESKLDIACEKTVTAGEPLSLYLKSSGGADAKWRISLVCPESSYVKWDLERTYTGPVALVSREIIVGKEVMGGAKGKIRVIQFETHPDDGGEYLGVLVESVNAEQYQHIFWVAVTEVPQRPRMPPPELPPDHPLSDPVVRGMLGDMAEVAEENWKREQAAGSP